MSYKTILVHADQSSHAPARMALAARLALTCDAHLSALACTGISRYAQPGAPGHQGPLVPETLDMWRARARASQSWCCSTKARASRSDPRAGTVATATPSLRSVSR